MIKVTPIPTGITISYKEKEVQQEKLKLDDWILEDLTTLVHGIKDNDGHKISALSYNGKIIFSRLLGGNEIPAYVEDFPLQELRRCLKELELAIVEQWDMLFQENK